MLCRFPWRKLVLGVLGLVVTGCEPHGSWLRPKDDADSKVRSTGVEGVKSDASKMRSVDSDDDQKSEPFFKNNRRSGAWSSEGREIERDLGVN
jgi:hypothetical protein